MNKSTQPIGYAALVALSVFLFLFQLGGRDLWAPDEPRYAQVAEEIRTRPYGARSVVVMHLNGEVYTQKPPLYFWLAAGFGAFSGRVTETAARLPSALAGIGVVLLALWIGRRAFGAGVALLGGGLLVTAQLFLHIGRRAQLDMLLALFETIALAAFWHYVEEGRRRKGLLALLHLAMGLAMLVKGPVGFIVPGLIMVVYLAWQRRWRMIREVFPWWSFLLSLGPALLWLAATLCLTPPGFFNEAVVDNIFSRFAEGTSHVRPFYYFLYQFPADFMPWTLLWLFCWKGAAARWKNAAGGRIEAAWRFFAVWVGVSLIFFSISAGKRGLYLIPAFPAMALLTADALWAAWEQRRMPAWLFRLLPAGLAGLSMAGGAGVLIVQRAGGIELPPGYGLILLAVGLLGLAGSAAAVRRHSGMMHFAVMILVAGGIQLATFCILFPALEAGKSPRPIAEAAARAAGQDATVALISKHTIQGGLLYYGNCSIAIVRNFDELSAFYKQGGQIVVGHLAVAEELYSDRFRFEIVESFREGHRALSVMKISPKP